MSVVVDIVTKMFDQVCEDYLQVSLIRKVLLRISGPQLVQNTGLIFKIKELLQADAVSTMFVSSEE